MISPDANLKRKRIVFAAWSLSRGDIVSSVAHSHRSRFSVGLSRNRERISRAAYAAFSAPRISLIRSAGAWEMASAPEG